MYIFYPGGWSNGIGQVFSYFFSAKIRKEKLRTKRIVSNGLLLVVVAVTIII